MSAHRRIQTITQQISVDCNQSKKVISARQTAAAASVKSDDDVVVVASFRTAIGRANKGDFSQTYVEDLLAPVLKAVIDQTKIDPASVGDIVIGSVLGNGSQRANECRIAAFFAGFPETVPIHVVNRQCSSGLQAIAHVAASIKAGYYDIGIGGGVESMSSNKFKWQGSVNPHLATNQLANSCLVPMGITSENVAEKYNVTREEQDQLAVMSHKRAAQAIQSGRFKDEIVPVKVTLKDEKTGAERTVVVDTDGGVRANTTLEGLNQLKAVFKKNGTTTAGNSSQVSDGAAATLLMKRSTAKKLGLPIIAKFVSFAVTGVDPNVMGIGPATAIPKAIQMANLTLNDIDLFEINEAFASQATYCVKKLGLSWDKVNVNGGAIALGHPLGTTGSRMTATLLHELSKRKQRFGIVSMCIGSGMGAAAVYEMEN